MKDKISKHLKKRFPLCDDAYFDKVAGEIVDKFEKAGWARIGVCWKAGVQRDELVGLWLSDYLFFIESPLAGVDRYVEDDQGIVDTVIVT